jgi:peptidoglycan hydrolase-like protein with peptidoglycan-binding domain
VVVENGEQAVQQVSRGDFDLILMDIRMPEMSGPEATRAIRSRSDSLAWIPIIAEPYYAALLARDGESFKIRIGDQMVDVTAEELQRHWYGTFILLWKMPPDYRGNLRLGDAGPSVAWLRQNLATVQRIDLRTPEPQLFDQDLQSALIRFQRDHALIPDGIAGPITWIAVNSATSDGDPRLSSGS